MKSRSGGQRQRVQLAFPWGEEEVVRDDNLRQRRRRDRSMVEDEEMDETTMRLADVGTDGIVKSQ